MATTSTTPSKDKTEILEEDDEFEEFETGTANSGIFVLMNSPRIFVLCCDL